MLNVSIIIPAYNEEKGIGITIDHIQTHLSTKNISYEIIVVDDGSTDQTANVVSQKNVELIRLSKNTGYGASIKKGVSKAKYDIILITDADGTYPAEEISSVLTYAEQYDMVVGARTSQSAAIPLIRKPAKWFLTQLANFLSEHTIPDLNSGLRSIKKSIFLKFLKILPDGFSLTTTITLALLTNDYQVKYVSINYLKRLGTSKIKPIRDTLNFILLIIRTVLLFNPLKIFFSMSVCLMTISLITFFYSFLFLPYVLDMTALVLFLGGIQILAIGMLADLINKRI